MDAGTANAYAGAAQSIAGVVESIAAFKRQQDAMILMQKAAEKEMQAIQIQGEEQARTAVQRAYSALADSKFLSETTIANIRHINEQESSAIGTTVAQTAGAGLDFIGSPVLLAAQISLNANRMVQNQRLTEEIGLRKFEFEVDKEMRNVTLARQGAQIALDATAISRGAQIGAASFDAFKSLSNAGNQVSSILTSEGFRSILKPKPTPAFNSIPQQPATTDGYPI